MTPPLAQDSALLRQAIAQIAALPDQLRQLVTDKAWASIPTHINEFAGSANLGVGVPLAARPQTGALELITSISIYASPGAIGTLQLGDKVLPWQSLGNPIVIAPLELLLASTDVRTLTLTTAGSSPAAAFLLTGHQLPTFGTLAN